MEQFLIAHKVRGEPAFDIAINIGNEEDGDMWIIPTSGHRAYPYWKVEVDALLVDQTASVHPFVIHLLPSLMPPDLPDHYEVSAAPKGKGSGTSGRDLLAKLGLAKPLEPLKRRSW